MLTHQLRLYSSLSTPDCTVESGFVLATGLAPALLSSRVFWLQKHTQAIREPSHSKVEWDPRVFTPSEELSTQTLFCAQSFFLDLTVQRGHIAPCKALAFLVHKTLGGFKRGNI